MLCTKGLLAARTVSFGLESAIKGKKKNFNPCFITALWKRIKYVKVKAHTFSTWALDGGECLAFVSSLFISCIHYTG
jgi:hypothetical protein